MRNVLLVLSALALIGFSAAALAQSPPKLDAEPGGAMQPRPPGSGGEGGGAPGGGRSAVYGAIAFTADGSYATAWGRATQAEAEAHVAKECAAFGRGSCRTIGFSGEYCVALVHYRSRRWRISFPGAGTTYPTAQQDAMHRCEEDRRTRRRGCTLRVVVCGDGR